MLTDMDIANTWVKETHLGPKCVRCKQVLLYRLFTQANLSGKKNDYMDVFSDHGKLCLKFLVVLQQSRPFELNLFTKSRAIISIIKARERSYHHEPCICTIVCKRKERTLVSRVLLLLLVVVINISIVNIIHW